MALIAALLIFMHIAAAIWLLAVAIYQSLTRETEVRRHPLFVGGSVLSVTLVALVWFVPFLISYPLSLAAWWLAVRGIFELPRGRAGLLFGLLAALSFVARLSILGALNF